MNRTDRLIGILQELQARGELRAEDLARTFEVSVRTVYRDVQALSETGVPVVATEFPHAVELLADGPGLLVPHQDPEAMAAAIRHLIHEPGLTGRLTGLTGGPTLRWPAVAARYQALEVPGPPPGARPAIPEVVAAGHQDSGAG